MKDADTEVLIAGAGPTGLALAIMLRLFGRRVRVVDPLPQPAAISKALAVWSGSLEALGALGLASRFESQAVRLQSVQLGSGDRQLASVVIGPDIDSHYPFALLLPQSRTEAILAQHLAELGAAPERGLALAGFTQDADGVTATLTRADGSTEAVRSKYLVGADGARSATRRALGIEFQGYTEPDMFVLADVAIEGGDLDHRSIRIWWHGGSTVAMFPYGGGVWRIFANRGRTDDDSPPTLEEMQGHVDRHGPPGLKLRHPVWLSAFRTNERLAASYRTGRVFLAGDAAHIHTPAGGQGMNTGLQDAFNLGWKLAYVLEGRGDAELLLDSYEAERRLTARAVIARAAFMLRMGMSGSRLAEALRTFLVPIVTKLHAVRRTLQVELSETAITYRDGPLIELAGPTGLKRRADPGTRALDAPLAGGRLWPHIGATRHTLLLFGEAGQIASAEALAAGLGDAVKLVHIDAASDPQGVARRRYRMSGPGWVLVRPDQFIAARGGGASLHVLANYLERVVRTAG